ELADHRRLLRGNRQESRGGDGGGVTTPAAKKPSSSKGKARLEVRRARSGDVAGIAALVRRAYDDLPAYTSGEIRGQINNFPEGCFVAILDGTIVGYCASMQLSEELVLQPHTWDEITGNGFGSRHDPTGD